MEVDELGELEALERDLVENGPEFSFRQAVRLMRGPVQRLWGYKEGHGARVRILPQLSLEAPGSEIAGIWRGAEGYEVRTTFFGLYGAASPLPAFYTEELMEAAREDRAGAQVVLDIVHERLYDVRERAVGKSHPMDEAVVRDESRFASSLRSLIGLRDEAVREAVPDSDRMLRYLGLLGPMQRSAVGLRTLLRDALKPVSVDIDECVERLVRVPQSSRLALGERNHRLGDSAIVGSFVRDRMGRFRVRIGPMQGHQFHRLVNDATYWHWLVAVIGLYVTAPLQCELELALVPGAVGTTVLGDSMRSGLGQSTWLVSNDSQTLRATLQVA